MWWPFHKTAGRGEPVATTHDRACWKLVKPADIAPAAANSAADAYRLNTAGSVAVATDTYWNEDMAAAPRGVKLQLLSIGGVAQYDTYKGEAFWVGWAPVPRRRPA